MAEIRTVPAVDAYIVSGGFAETSLAAGTAAYAYFDNNVGLNTAEDERRSPLPESATVAEVTAHVLYAGTGTATAKLLKNGVDTGFGLTWTSGDDDTTFGGTANIEVAVGDTLQWEITHDQGTSRNMGMVVAARVVPK